ncbi:serine/threonine-protein kinase [Patulibacter americanus]|uniref:serine/threonine-protein kinase n=1 Tax=Patulibacter americanus TaxID=588672 RepID=UPI0003B5CC4A|nr:serine/threonine-protein kinase [Patulibacter americanus]
MAEGGVHPGALVGGHRVERELGRGAMGTVWLAEHVTLGRRVALKVLAHGLADDPSFQDRFMREARLAARLDHPNVVPVYDAGTDPAGLWLSMRYVEGEDLRRRLNRVAAAHGSDGMERQGPAGGAADPDATVAAGRYGLPPEEVVAIVEGIAAGLDHAHERGILHRDVKPGNVLLEASPRERGRPVRGAGGTGDDPVLTPWRRVLLADFGLTKDLDEQHDLTQTGMLLGSTDAMAPEQIEGRRVDARVDVYALTSLLYVALTGEPPFTGPAMAKLFAHVNNERPQVSALLPGLGAFDAVVAAGMARDPDDRPASAGELAALARKALAGDDDGQATVAFAAPSVPAAPPRPRPPATGVPLAPRLRERDEPPRDEPVRDERPDATRVAPAAAGPRTARPAAAAPPAGPPHDPGAPGDGRGGGSPKRWILPAVVGVLLLAVIVAAVALGLGGSGGDDTRAETSTRTTTRDRPASTVSTAETPATPEPEPEGTTEEPPTTTEEADPAAADITVSGGGTVRGGAPENDPGQGAPLPADGAAATYVSSDGSWRTLVARPGGGWSKPTRSSQSGGALIRLRQRGPEGRLILVDHTPKQKAAFDTSNVLETRTIGGTAFGEATGYRFNDARIASIPECASAQCVDVPLNASESGPGWGVLVAAPTADEAWALVERVVRATGPTG